MNLQDKTTTTIRAYNNNVHSYTPKFSWYAPYVKYTTEFSALMKDGFKVLDIGCGPGGD